MGKALSKPVCVAAGVCYPAYASFKALESPSPHDDKQWLTYWAVYGISTSAETVSSRFLDWLPGYYLVKMLVLIWMMLPRTKGALIMYNSVIYPLLKKYEPLIDKKLVQAQADTDECIRDIQANGTDAIARRVVQIQKSEFVQSAAKALAQPPTSPQSSQKKTEVVTTETTKVEMLTRVDVEANADKQ